MSPELVREVLPNLCLGLFFIGFGLHFSRSRQNLARLKSRLLAKYSGKLELDVLFRPVEGRFFNALNTWIGTALIIAGISRLMALIPSINSQYSLVLLGFGIGQVFLAVGLQYIFTGKAFVYWRHLVWSNLNSWRPNLATVVQIVMVRLFGIIFLGLGSLSVYVCAAVVLATTGVIEPPRFPWLGNSGG